MRLNYSDTRFTCDPIVDGIIEESPKETNNGCFEDEKKHIDLDGLDLLPADEATSPLLLRCGVTHICVAALKLGLLGLRVLFPNNGIVVVHLDTPCW